jgi:hypothetical protein
MSAFHPLRTFGCNAIACGVSRNLIKTGPLDAYVRPILGLPAWGVKHGHGSFLTFEFGQPILKGEERRQSHDGRLRRSALVHGEWHLWIYCCHWRASEGGRQLAWSEDDDEAIGRAAAALNGQKLTAVNVSPTDGRSTFTFDLGGSLETWPYGDDPKTEQWIIHGRTEVFVYRADGYYLQQDENTSPGQERWLPLV